jgi:lysophospholipase L1-like esterase
VSIKQFYWSLRNSFHWWNYRRMKMREFRQLDIFDKIVLIGDSQVEFFKASYSDFEFVNLGIAGERINGLCSRLSSILLEKPKEVVLLIGINDVLANKSNHQIITSFTKLLDVLNYYEVPYKVIEIIQVGYNRNHFNPQITATNKILHSLISPNRIIPLSDLGFFSDDMVLDRKYSDDGLHLNELGYARLNKIIFSKIQSK